MDNHHRLGVDMTGQLRFALDIRHIAITKVYGRGEAHRLTEIIRVTGDLNDRQAVDLANLFAIGLQQESGRR